MVTPLTTFMAESELQISPFVLSPCSSGRRSSSDSKSPEFEFWMVRNPTLPQPNLLSADELFSDGVLLPLHLLELPPDDPPDRNQEKSGSDQTEPKYGSSAEVSSGLDGMSTLTSIAASKRWKDIFRKSDSSKEREKEKKKDKKNESGAGKNSNGNNGIRVAELNINIWPFSRSRSAGTGGSRPRMAVGAGARKVSSAPCSRSNSRGESKSRKLPSSLYRGGVNLGRNSPVRHVRRGGSGRRSIDRVMVKNDEKCVKKDTDEARREQPTATLSGRGEGSKAKALQLNVPMCIGYKNHLGCRSHEKAMGAVTTVAGGGRAGSESGEVVRGSNLFNIRNLFTKKVH